MKIVKIKLTVFLLIYVTMHRVVFWNSHIIWLPTTLCSNGFSLEYSYLQLSYIHAKFRTCISRVINDQHSYLYTYQWTDTMRRIINLTGIELLATSCATNSYYGRAITLANDYFYLISAEKYICNIIMSKGVLHFRLHCQCHKLLKD